MDTNEFDDGLKYFSARATPSSPGDPHLRMSENTDAAVVARLLDGRTVSLRRLTGDDADAVVRLHERLNDQDRYFRFFTLHPAGLERLVRALVGPDEKHCTVGAFDGDRLIGVANYVVSDDPTVAEMAVVVAHEDHMHGVGTALLKHLAHVAAGAGIRRFTADVLAENHLMLGAIRDCGWPQRKLAGGTTVRLEMQLPDADPPSPAGAR